MQMTQLPLWQRPLIRELAIILLLKLIILILIKTVWFDAPTVPQDGVNRVEKHLLGETAPLTRKARIRSEEAPK